MNDSPSEHSESAGCSAAASNPAASLMNIPNLLRVIRLVGSVILPWLAIERQETAFLWLFSVLLMTDWVDGKLAILLKQQTTFGARLDSVADALMYAALLFGVYWLKWKLVQQEFPWLAAVIASYLLTVTAALWKYRRLPSYHTRAAKTCWFLVGVAALLVFADFHVVSVLRITATAIVATNLEATAITIVLPEWATNVTSLWHAWRRVHPPQPRVEN
ncbi:MAG: CDP-alcohol phosphatidyltransferase family protein [Planctomycetaceae bacterium]|nr:CDP-alcohol phosphatidyltransferase family protein [Planctomycetaceae bacterium]